MKKVRKRPVRVRRRWVMNPKTRVKKSSNIYHRPKAKKELPESEEYYEERSKA